MANRELPTFVIGGRRYKGQYPSDVKPPGVYSPDFPVSISARDLLKWFVKRHNFGGISNGYIELYQLADILGVRHRQLQSWARTGSTWSLTTIRMMRLHRWATEDGVTLRDIRRVFWDEGVWEWGQHIRQPPQLPFGAPGYFQDGTLGHRFADAPSQAPLERRYLVIPRH